MIKYEEVRKIKGVRAMQVVLNGEAIIKYAELPNGAVRLLWVADVDQDSIAAVNAIDDALGMLTKRAA